MSQERDGHYTLHAFDYDRTSKEEIPKVFSVEFMRWKFEPPYEPISWVARYELVEVVAGKLKKHE
jgi:hypothetical protein